MKQAENSDVFPLGSVAVAVITSPIGTSATDREKFPFPSGWVTIGKCARKRAPSPFPDGSHEPLAKSSTVYAVSPMLLSVPVIEVDPPSVCAEATTGKFWRPFGPVSPSPSSF